MSLPSRMISSFTVELVQVTPGLILTCRTYFSPKKLRTSTRVLFSDTVMLMGKWAYTAFILYLKPLGWQTPVRNECIFFNTIAVTWWDFQNQDLFSLDSLLPCFRPHVNTLKNSCNQNFKIVKCTCIESSRHSVSWGAVQKTARQKIKRKHSERKW